MSWIRTYTGASVFPLDPSVEDIHIEDIAHALSNQCRFSGHTLYHYSVAQHCVYLADRILWLTKSKKLTLAMLMHDASEAYLVDVPRPIKGLMPGYEVAERVMQGVIHERFSITVDSADKAMIKKYDDAILYDESIALFPLGKQFVELPLNVERFKIQRWTSFEAKEAFLDRFKALAITDGSFT